MSATPTLGNDDWRQWDLWLSTVKTDEIFKHETLPDGSKKKTYIRDTSMVRCGRHTPKYRSHRWRKEKWQHVTIGEAFMYTLEKTNLFETTCRHVEEDGQYCGYGYDFDADLPLWWRQVLTIQMRLHNEWIDRGSPDEDIEDWPDAWEIYKNEQGLGPSSAQTQASVSSGGLRLAFKRPVDDFQPKELQVPKRQCLKTIPLSSAATNASPLAAPLVSPCAQGDDAAAATSVPAVGNSAGQVIGLQLRFFK